MDSLRTRYNAVEVLLQDYVDATFHGDVNKLKAIFHPEAIMSGYMGEELQIGTPEPFFHDIESNPPMGDPFQATVTQIQVTGNVAIVTMYSTGFFGEGTLEDHFQLIKDETGQWKIIAKCFTTL